MLSLPIDPFLPEILARLRSSRAVVIVAAPGAGKTTRVPPALAEDGRVLVLQPRRIAARSLARRIAAERGWTIGREVGWHVRFERQFTSSTRVILATEGVLTARAAVRSAVVRFPGDRPRRVSRAEHPRGPRARVRQAGLASAQRSAPGRDVRHDGRRHASATSWAVVRSWRSPGSLHPLEIRYRVAGGPDGRRG